jgi:hypothetical protein
MKSEAEFDAQRRVFRAHTRRLLQTRHDPAVHLARIEAALEVAGAEPVQGALADLFCAFGPAHAVTKQTILDKSMARLPAHVGNWFASQVHAPALPVVSPLATRWSVLAVVSADISTRARRCSADDSRLLAAQVVDAVGRSDLQAQQLFLHHCLTCHDNLAFMLARRQLLKRDGELPPAWEATSVQLEMTQA